MAVHACVLCRRLTQRSMPWALLFPGASTIQYTVQYKTPESCSNFFQPCATQNYRPIISSVFACDVSKRATRCLRLQLSTVRGVAQLTSPRWNLRHHREHPHTKQQTDASSTLGSVFGLMCVMSLVGSKDWYICMLAQKNTNCLGSVIKWVSSKLIANNYWFHSPCLRPGLEASYYRLHLGKRLHFKFGMCVILIWFYTSNLRCWKDIQQLCRLSSTKSTLRMSFTVQFLTLAE